MCVYIQNTMARLTKRFSAFHRPNWANLNCQLTYLLHMHLPKSLNTCHVPSPLIGLEWPAPRRTRFCIQSALMPRLHPGRTSGPLRTEKRGSVPLPAPGFRVSSGYSCWAKDSPRIYSLGFSSWAKRSCWTQSLGFSCSATNSHWIHSSGFRVGDKAPANYC